MKFNIENNVRVKELLTQHTLLMKTDKTGKTCSATVTKCDSDKPLVAADSAEALM